MASTDEMEVDLSDYKDRQGAQVIPGRYRVVVDDTEGTNARDSGNKMINVWLRILGGEFDGMVIVDRLVQDKNSLFRTVGFMQAIGLPTPKKKFKVNFRSWIGKVLEVDVDDGKPFLGKIKSEVRGYLRVVGATNSQVQADLPDDAEGLDEFDAETTQNPEEPRDPGVPREDAVEEVKARLADMADVSDLQEEGEPEGDRSDEPINLEDLKL